MLPTIVIIEKVVIGRTIDFNHFRTSIYYSKIFVSIVIGNKFCLIFLIVSRVFDRVDCRSRSNLATTANISFVTKTAWVSAKNVPKKFRGRTVSKKER